MSFSQFGSITYLTKSRKDAKRQSYRRKELSSGFVVFMSNKVIVITLVQIFELLNKDVHNE